MSIDYYRRIFVTDMANRTVDSEFNVLTSQQWHEEWKQMLVPGAYERGIFGDLMLPGIACGVQKILLIFNTNLSTPHDPIYVVDPSQFNVSPDTNIPIILAYNMSHYESMEPLTDIDTQKCIDLFKNYKDGKYKYKKKDLPFLLNIDNTRPADPAAKNKPNICYEPSRESNDRGASHKNATIKRRENLQAAKEETNRIDPEKVKKPESKKKNVSAQKYTATEQYPKGTSNIDDLWYRLKNGSQKFPIATVDGNKLGLSCAKLS